jgi:2-dehydropantoate 2-reductase
VAQIKDCGLELIHHTNEKETLVIQAEQVDQTEQIQADCIVIAVKSYEVETVLKYQLNSKAMLFLQNGMRHVQSIQNIKSAEVAVAVVEHGAMRETVRSVKHTGIGRIKWGSVGEEQGYIATLMEQLNQPSFPTERQECWKDMLERKLVVNACINPLTALFRVENGKLLQNSSYKKMMERVFAEAVTVLGHPKDQGEWELVCQICEDTAPNRSSMLKDLDHGRRTEIDSIVGYLLDRALEKNMDTPLLTFLFNEIKGE